VAPPPPALSIDRGDALFPPEAFVVAQVVGPMAGCHRPIFLPARQATIVACVSIFGIASFGCFCRRSTQAQANSNNIAFESLEVGQDSAFEGKLITGMAYRRTRRKCGTWRATRRPRSDDPVPFAWFRSGRAVFG
jgi:hypothetical protein